MSDHLTRMPWQLSAPPVEIEAPEPDDVGLYRALRDLPGLLRDGFEHLEGSYTELNELLAGNLLNDTLWSGVIAFDANGVYTQARFKVPFGAVVLHNLGTASITLTNNPVQAAVPASGAGVHIVPAGSGVTANIVGNVLTVYGRAGELANLEVYIRPLPPSVAGSPASGTVGSAAVLTPVQLTGGDQLITNVANANLGAFTIGESTGTAGAKLYIRDGVNAAGIPRIPITLAPNESIRDPFMAQGLRFAAGIFVDQISGAFEGAVWLGNPA